MANPWFRMYSEFATDAKVQMLSEAMQRRYRPRLFCPGRRARASRDSSSHYAQLARLGLGIKLHPGLLQYPRLDALMVQAQQV